MERSPVDLSDVLAFLRIVETGSLSRAADRLGMSKSIVSRRLASLEANLGARLITRGARGAQPTEVGQAYYARAVNALAGLEAAHEMVAEAVSEIAGPLRLAAPLSFGVEHLAPALAAFVRQHPRVELDASFEDRPIDLVGGGFDLGIRIGNLADSALVARKLGTIARLVLASPAYLTEHGTPGHPRDLTRHQVLLYSNAGTAEQWRFKVDGVWEHVRVRGRLRADNGEMLREAACAGLGLVILPSFIARPALNDGRLSVVLAEFPLEPAGLYAVMPPGRATTARVRALMEFLAAGFLAVPP